MSSTLPQQTYDVIANHLTDNEEGVDWPYLDTKGHITIGVGFKIDNEGAFVALDLTTVRDGKTVPATGAEKRAAYQRMQEIRKERNGDFNPTAIAYRGKTPLRMSQNTIDIKLRAEIENRVNKIRAEVGDVAWNKLNDRQKAAVIDIDYANGDGSLKGFPELKKAVIKGDGKAMADQSTFYTNKEKGERHLERLQRNYEALSGFDPEKANETLAELLEKQETERRKAEDQEVITEEIALPDEELDNSDGPTPEDEKDDEKGRTATDASTNKEDSDRRQLAAALSQPVDTVDDALLKDGLTDSELKSLMQSVPYLKPSDPRHEQAQTRVKQWFDDHWGTNPTPVDASGRMILDANPEIPFPQNPIKSTETATNTSLDEGVRQVAERVADRARLTNPFESVKTLQSTLNNHRDPVARAFPPLKEDGIAGPKTSRALRYATKRLGARGLLGELFG